MRKGWPDVIVAAYIVGAGFFYGPLSSVLASESPPATIPELRIDLRDRATTKDVFERLSGLALTPPPDGDWSKWDTGCRSDGSPDSYAIGNVEARQNWICWHPIKITALTAERLCAAKFGPEHTASRFDFEDMVLVCKVKGKAV